MLFERKSTEFLLNDRSGGGTYCIIIYAISIRAKNCVGETLRVSHVAIIYLFSVLEITSHGRIFSRHDRRATRNRLKKLIGYDPRGFFCAAEDTKSKIRTLCVCQEDIVWRPVHKRKAGKLKLVGKQFHLISRLSIPQ